MSFKVRIIGPSGLERGLCRGREVEFSNATRYSHPSAARKAIASYLKPGRWKRPPLAEIIDPEDPERRIE